MSETKCSPWQHASDAFGGTIETRKCGRYIVEIGMTDHGEGYQGPSGWWWTVRHQGAKWEVSGVSPWHDTARTAGLNMVRRLGGTVQ